MRKAPAILAVLFCVALLAYSALASYWICAGLIILLIGTLILDLREYNESSS